MSTIPVRVRDLPETLHGEMLLCRQCRETYSAQRGDYFLADPETVFRHCHRPMLLVTKRTVYSEARMAA